MIVGFTGTQRGMTLEQHRSLGILFLNLPISEFHHGDCVGADAEAHEDAWRIIGNIVIHPPTNPKGRAFCHLQYGNEHGARVKVLDPAPYIARNHDIVDAADRLIACPRNTKKVVRSGTWATIRYAIRRGKHVIVVWPDGLIQDGYE